MEKSAFLEPYCISRSSRFAVIPFELFPCSFFLFPSLFEDTETIPEGSVECHKMSTLEEEERTDK